MFGRISKRLPQPVYRCVQPTFKIDEGVVRPEPRFQLIARDNLAGPFQQGVQEGEWLVGQALLPVTVPQVTGPRIQCERAEANPAV